MMSLKRHASHKFGNWLVHARPSQLQYIQNMRLVENRSELVPKASSINQGREGLMSEPNQWLAYMPGKWRNASVSFSSTPERPSVIQWDQWCFWLETNSKSASPASCAIPRSSEPWLIAPSCERRIVVSYRSDSEFRRPDGSLRLFLLVIVTLKSSEWKWDTVLGLKETN